VDHEETLLIATPEGTPIMAAPCNISHILSDVDVFCDKYPSNFPSEQIEEMRRVGKSTMTRLFTSMVSPYGANISGYSVRDQKTFGKVDMDKNSAYSSQDIVRFIERVYEQHKDVILHTVISSIEAYLLSFTVDNQEETTCTWTVKNGVSGATITTTSPKVESVNQDFVDALLNPENIPTHLVSISNDRYITSDGRVVRVIEDTASVWGGDQGSLFDDAPVVTPNAPTIEGDATQQLIAEMVEKHGDTYGPATVEAVGNDIANGNAVVEICHNPTEEGGLQYIISGRVQ
jgi:hypothetical protein